MKPKLLIVDDDEAIRTQLKWALHQDYEVFLAEDRAGALETFRDQRPPVVLLDLGLPPQPNGSAEGLAALSELLACDSRAKVIVATGQAAKQNALEAVAAGAHDFFSKPVAIEELQIILKRTFQLASLEREYYELQHQLDAEGFEGMVGASAPMQAVFSSIRKVATTDVPVLILGESGTGKEMVALALQRRGARRAGPFVAINCGAIPENLLESELFGHEKGAFTGAHAQRKGRIETAGGGTLFLDEIGELSPALQVKLLRFLQEGTFERVGGRQPIQVDARVIAATNADLKRAMAEGKFREDLYYRLAVVVIQLPPLRERGDDACLLARDLLRRYAAQHGKDGLAFDDEALRAIACHPWPGNVRELQNRIKRALIMAPRKRLTVRDLELDTASSSSPPPGLREARESLEREMVQQALRKHGGKITTAAAELKISRPTLYELMDKLGISRPEREEKE
jgi:two-component system, NtrC family, response regulator